MTPHDVLALVFDAMHKTWFAPRLVSRFQLHGNLDAALIRGEAELRDELCVRLGLLPEQEHGSTCDRH